MKKTNIIVTSAVLMLTIFAGTTQAGYVEPGSESDPLVSQSYVEKKFNESKQNSNSNKEKLEEMEKKIEKLSNANNNDNNNNSGNNNQVAQEGFKVIELKKGQILVADESTEIIIRSGTVTAIASKNGGISDITDAKDLQTGEEVELNHLLIIPRTDGRGIEVKSNNTFMMIKGKYKTH